MAHRDDRPAHINHHFPPSHYPPPYSQPPTAQPPIQIPFSDPFQTSRDPFAYGGQHGRRESFGAPARGWPPSQAPGNGNGIPPHPQQQQQQSQHTPHTSHASPSGPPLPPPPPNGLGQMAFSFDPARRRSLGAAGSPPQYVAGPLEPPPPPPPPHFPSRNMPPPSPPQMPLPAASAHLASAPRGPPISSPFAGVRDLAGFAPHRSGAGMSISSILGGEERKPNGSPRSTATVPISTPNMMRPPSPGRARSASMREEFGRREPSPMRGGIFGEPRAQSAFHERMTNEPRRDIFASPQFQRESPHSFRAFRPEQQDSRPPVNGTGMLGRPSSQPIELQGPRSVEDIIGRRETPAEGRFGAFRHFAEPHRSERTPRHDPHPFPNGVTSQPREHEVFGSPQMDRDLRQPPGRFQPGLFGTPMREDQAGLFRPAYHPMPDARESIEGRPLHDLRREDPGSSPPMSDFPLYARGPNAFIDRPMTFEEHQRMEALHREQQQRKESDGSVHRSVLGISPEFNRKGRNSPLPQAVQGAQSRHVGPGGNNPGIKMEFGRMFSGLGSGVGSATPTAGQSVNGITTPSRLSPARYLEDGDIVRTAVAGLEDSKGGMKGKGGRKNGRRSREDEKLDDDGRETPDLQRGSKRTKTNHQGHHHHHHLHSHHHHHHHHEDGAPPGSFNMLRFPSNPGVSQPSPAAHHHHHHHATHAHPSHHHHHHAPRSAAMSRKPTTTVISAKLLEESASKPRQHLGSQLYTTELSQPSNAEMPLDSKTKFNSKMRPIPLFEGQDNCTYTVRVPRYYLTPSQRGEQNEEPSSLEEVCKRRQIWGTDVYTDDSDVVAAAVHSGWLKGDFGDATQDLHELCDNDSEVEDAVQGGEETVEVPITLTSRPPKPVRVPPDHDLHVTVLILPPLEGYASTMQHHLRSREWAGTHDGMSFMIHRVDFVDEGVAGRFVERGVKARKQRIAMEEQKRREAAAVGLLMFANGAGVGGAAVVSVGA